MINGHNVSFYNDITLYTQDFTKDTDAEIVIKRNGEKKTISFKPTEIVELISYTENGVDYAQSVNGNDRMEHFDYSEEMPYNAENVGKVQTNTSYIIGFRPVQENVTILNVWGEAWNQTRFVVKLVYQSLWQMITGKVGIEQVSGPVGIVSEVNTAVNSGPQSYLYVLNLVALITINLGVFNLLPFPALDGGRLFFMIVELIRRKPIPPEKEGMVHAVGMLLLLALVVFISFNDILKLFG